MKVYHPSEKLTSLKTQILQLQLTLELSQIQEILSTYTDFLLLFAEYPSLFNFFKNEPNSLQGKNALFKNRFITQDPARDGGNWWNYCNGNPMVRIDFDGLINHSIESTYKMNSTTNGQYDYQNEILNDSSVNNHIYESGCAITIAANLATERNAAMDPNDINTELFIDASGNVSWDMLATQLDMELNNGTEFTINQYEAQENDSNHLYYTAIKVQYCNNASSPHWVGVNGTETVDGIDYFIISPTSENDSSVNANQLRGQQGWIMNSQNQILVPTNKVSKYHTFSVNINQEE